jgi:hypothetical protein
MAIAQRFDSTQRADQMTLRRLLADCQQCIGRPTKRRYYDCRLAVETSFDDRSGALDRVRIAD